MNTMASDIPQTVMDQMMENKSFEFVKLYKSATDIEDMQIKKKNKKMNKNSQAELNALELTPLPNKIPKKKHKSLDLSHTEAAEHNSSKAMRSSRKGSLTSTPNSKDEHLDNSVKSIMKNQSNNIDPKLNLSDESSPKSKPKKRNKSVSFMLEDAEEMTVKKTKSNNSSKEHKTKEKDHKNEEKKTNTKIYRRKKSIQLKETQRSDEDMNCSNKENVTVANEIKDSTSDAPANEVVPLGVKKKVKKNKKNKKPQADSDLSVPKTEEVVSGESSSENKPKKSKKKKRKAKSTQDGNADSMDGEPATKSRKKDLKPEVIAEGLENLNIGDNAHTLTNLLDEMSVVDKNAKKKERQKQKRNKAKKQETKHMSAEGNSEAPPQSSNEEREKVKWSKRKWNKDVKGVCDPKLNTSVVVEKLPIRIMCNYKKLLSEHFSKFGAIAGVGVAEVYPTEDLKPVFTTTVYFQEGESVNKAVSEDNTVFEGSRIAVRRARAPAERTLVARGHGLTEQGLSTLFTPAGRVRAIRLLVKGKKSTPTAFVEFDGPETVEKALKIAQDARINGKKLYVSKYEIRKKRKPNPTEKNSVNGNDEDSSTSTE